MFFFTAKDKNIIGFSKQNIENSYNFWYKNDKRFYYTNSEAVNFSSIINLTDDIHVLTLVNDSKQTRLYLNNLEVLVKESFNIPFSDTKYNIFGAILNDTKSVFSEFNFYGCLIFNWLCDKHEIQYIKNLFLKQLHKPSQFPICTVLDTIFEVSPTCLHIQSGKWFNVDKLERIWQIYDLGSNTWRDTEVKDNDYYILPKDFSKKIRIKICAKNSFNECTVYSEVYNIISTPYVQLFNVIPYYKRECGMRVNILLKWLGCQEITCLVNNLTSNFNFFVDKNNYFQDLKITAVGCDNLNTFAVSSCLIPSNIFESHLQPLNLLFENNKLILENNFKQEGLDSLEFEWQGYENGWNTILRTDVSELDVDSLILRDNNILRCVSVAKNFYTTKKNYSNVISVKKEINQKNLYPYIESCYTFTHANLITKTIRIWKNNLEEKDFTVLEIKNGTLTSWLNGSEGRVKIWYDISPYGRHLVSNNFETSPILLNIDNLWCVSSEDGLSFFECNLLYNFYCSYLYMSYSFLQSSILPVLQGQNNYFSYASVSPLQAKDVTFTWARKDCFTWEGMQTITPFKNSNINIFEYISDPFNSLQVLYNQQPLHVTPINDVITENNATCTFNAFRVPKNYKFFNFGVFNLKQNKELNIILKETIRNVYQ
jgi:hypothetical protein